MGTRYTSAAYRELGGMLRQVPDRAGLRAGELARKLGWPQARISRMELGWRTSTTMDVIQYLVTCGMTVPEAQPILRFARTAERKQGYYLSDGRIDGTLQSLIFHESLAEHSIVYEPLAIPGLLQIPDYARAHIIAVEPSIAQERLSGGVRTRMERRQVLSLLNRGRFTFFIPEQALRLQVGTDEIMQEQLLHLALTAGMAKVAIRIVPSAAGTFGDAFRLMVFQEHHPIVYLDNLRFGGLVLEDPDYVSSYRELVPVLANAALDEGQSRQFAAEMADAHDRGSQRRVADVLAEEQLQPRRGNGLCGGGVAEEQLQPRRRNGLCGGGVVEVPTPIYE